jgi:hypothetical protein
MLAELASVSRVWAGERFPRSGERFGKQTFTTKLNDFKGLVA